MRFRDLKKQSKQTNTKKEEVGTRYAGYYSRIKAFITDMFMIGLPVALVILIFFGKEETQSAGAMAVIVQDEVALQHAPNPTASIVQILLIMGVHIVLWRRSGQTPGKKFADIKVVDAKTLKEASYPKLFIRFIGYFISVITLGFLIGLFRKDKRALHDLISGTAVICVNND